MKKIRVGWCIDTLVDDDDYEYLMQWRWNLNPAGYVRRSECIFGVCKTILMSRVILERKLGHNDFEVAEHENRNLRDNWRDNLRESTQQQNIRNSGKRSNCTSKYKGVSWHKQHDKWIARIGVNGKRIHSGYFDDEIEAARAYDRAAIKYFDEFICLNFDRSDYD